MDSIIFFTEIGPKLAPSIAHTPKNFQKFVTTPEKMFWRKYSAR